MKKTLIPAIAFSSIMASSMLASSMLASPAIAQDAGYHFFLGAAAGTSNILDEKELIKDTNKSIPSGIRLTEADASGTAYKITAGIGRDNVRFGVEYIDWGDVKTTYSVGSGNDTSTVIATTDVQTFGPWVGYSFDLGGGFDIMPKMGIAFGEAEATVDNRKVTVTENGFMGGVELAYNINDSLAVNIGYDSTADVNMLSAGFRYSIGK